MSRFSTLCIRYINQCLAFFGIEIRRAQHNNARMSLFGALRQFRTNESIMPRTIIDVGAAFGEWSKEVATLFPEATYILVEAVREYMPIIRHTTRTLSKVHIHNNAATSAKGPVTFFVHKDFVGSSLKTEHEEYNQKNSESRTVPGTTIDSLIEEHHSKGPYFIKIDVQGAEIDALKGAEKILPLCAGILLEVSLIQAFKDGPILHDIVSYMKSKGFIAYDMYSFSYRPQDKALAQVDMIFVPETSPLIKEKAFANEATRRAQDQKFRGIFEKHLKAAEVYAQKKNMAK